MLRRATTSCFACHRKGTRQVVVDDRLTWMCEDCPSPQQIAERAAELRETWPRWRWQQAKRDELRGWPIEFDDLARIGHVHQEPARAAAAD